MPIRHKRTLSSLSPIAAEAEDAEKSLLTQQNLILPEEADEEEKARLALEARPLPPSEETEEAEKVELELQPAAQQLLEGDEDET